MDKTKFEELLSGSKSVIERFVYYKITLKEDAKDILQDVYMTAFLKIDSLKDESNFRAWVIRIAQNKCNDYYKARAKQLEIPLDETIASVLTTSRFGITESSVVRETLGILHDKDKQILYLYFFRNKPQAEIAKLLGIPVGTVKSRFFNAKQSFKEKYPYPPRSKGDIFMRKLPEILPEYKITKSDQEPFKVKWEELMGWFLVPKLGEKPSWAMYDFPGRTRTQSTEMQVIGKASVHGIEGVEIVATEHNPMQFNPIGNSKNTERRFVAQLTDTHCRILAESHVEGDVRKFFTFLDGDEFLPNWGFGEDNCGNEINLYSKGRITRSGTEITCDKAPDMLDVVGRYIVEIAGKTYDTICVMDIEFYNSGVATEQFIDKSGRTILWRRFNRDDWAYNRYKQKWSDRLPNNERITINGETYVHWYDCITDYIL